MSVDFLSLRSNNGPLQNGNTLLDSIFAISFRLIVSCHGYFSQHNDLIRSMHGRIVGENQTMPQEHIDFYASSKRNLILFSSITDCTSSARKETVFNHFDMFMLQIVCGSHFAYS